MTPICDSLSGLHPHLIDGETESQQEILPVPRAGLEAWLPKFPSMVGNPTQPNSLSVGGRQCIL